jgi:hypothetical protein
MSELGQSLVRYSFIVMDLHHLLLAGLPAHSGLPRTTDINRPARLVRLVPISEDEVSRLEPNRPPAPCFVWLIQSKKCWLLQSSNER